MSRFPAGVARFDQSFRALVVETLIVMPKLRKENGELFPEVEFKKTWVQVGVEVDDNVIAVDFDTFLVHPRLADYIEMLEAKIEGDLPKLPKRENE